MSSRSHAEPLQSVHELKQRIVRRQLVFTGPQEQVMRMVLHCPAALAFGTLQSVARLCGVSAGTVSRLSVRAGYRGFGDMRLAFRRHLQHPAPGELPGSKRLPGRPFSDDADRRDNR